MSSETQNMNTKTFWSEKKIILGRITDYFSVQKQLILTCLATSLVSYSKTYSVLF